MQRVMCETWQCKLLLVLTTASALLVGASCGKSPPPPTSSDRKPPAAATRAVSGAQAGCRSVDKPQVMTTTYPMEYFAERIAGGLVRVESPLPEGEDPIVWKPPREVVERFQQTDVIVINGADFEQWIASAALPLSRICDTSRGFASEFVKFQSTKHRHGVGGMHSHEGIDGHTWMDPNNAVRQAERIEAALTRRWPEHSAQFRDNGQKLRADLQALDARFQELSGQITRVGLVASHPAYNYIAKRYGWNVTNIDLPPDLGAGESYAPEQLAALGHALKAQAEDANRSQGKSGHGRTVLVLFEQQPGSGALKALMDAEVMVRVRAMPVVFSPAESRPAIPEIQTGAALQRDFLFVMRANLDNLESALNAADADDVTGVSKKAGESAVPLAAGDG